MIDPRKIVENVIVEHTSFDIATKRVQRCFDYSGMVERAPCVVIASESHTGKSEILKGLLKKYPTYRTEESLIKPVIMMNTPSSPTVKGFAAAILKKLENPGGINGTEQSLTDRIETQFKELDVKVLMIDEFQHFVDRKKKDEVKKDVANWLKNLLNDTEISMVIAGLPFFLRVFEQSDGQLDGRFEAPLSLPRFVWSSKDSQEEFLGVLNAFDIELKAYFDMPVLASEEMAFRCYAACGGLIGYFVDTLKHATWATVDKGSNKLGLPELKKALTEVLWRHDPKLLEFDPFGSDFVISPTQDMLNLIDKIGGSGE